MAWNHDKRYNVHSYVYAVAFISFFTFSAVLVHNQTAFWERIQKLVPEEKKIEVLRGVIPGHGTASILVSHSARFEKAQPTEKRAASSPDGVQHSFKLVEGLSSLLYVYAALWDVTNVRLISIKRENQIFKDLVCVLYYSKDQINSSFYVEPIVKELHTKVSLYKSTAIKCPLDPKNMNRPAPLYVGLIGDTLTTPTVRFAVENREVASIAGGNGKDSDSLRQEVFVDFTVCIPALHGMTNAAQLVEKIEMSRLLGAGRMVFYNHSISSGVDAVLRMYVTEWAEGRETLQVVVLPWELPMLDGKPLNIRYFAQQLAMDDCLFRYKRLSRYMTFHDLDEFPVPLKHDDWSTLVAERRRLKPNSIGWLFRCSVLSKDRPSPAAGYEEDYLRYGSAIFGLTSRDSYVYLPNKRPKLIVDPTTIDEMGVHIIFEGNGTTDVLPVDTGLLFHYRSPIEACTPQIKETRMVDKYGKRLARRQQVIWSKLPGVELGWAPFEAADKSKCKKS